MVYGGRLYFGMVMFDYLFRQVVGTRAGHHRSSEVPSFTKYN